MNKKNFFPSGIAIGSAFCNRVQIRKQLIACFTNTEHLVLASPRRYGKTSLITQSIIDSKLPSVSLDLLLAPDTDYIKDEILTAVSELCSQLIEKKETLKERFIALFSDFNPKITFNALGQKLELSCHSNEPKTITHALMTLDKAAAEAGQQVVFVLDEFQQVAKLKKNDILEASIRHAVERSQKVSYVFSGSNRRLLEEMFQDKARPLYHLCELIRIKRIDATEFKQFIQHAAELKWGEALSTDVLERIITLSECHTFYTNAICRIAFKHHQPPSVNAIEDYWSDYIDEQKWITNDLAKMSANQMAIVTVLAKKPTKQLFGEPMRLATKMPPSSIDKTIQSLEKTDTIYRNGKGEYSILDPAVAYFLRRQRHRL